MEGIRSLVKGGRKAKGNKTENQVGRCPELFGSLAFWTWVPNHSCVRDLLPV